MISGLGIARRISIMGAEISCSRKTPIDAEEIPHSYFAGKSKDFKEGTCIEVKITDQTTVIVTKHKGNYYGTGSKCSHYGAPLKDGIIVDGRIKCPWHGACFDLSTGDIEDFPGLDGIPVYKTKIKLNRDVVVMVSPNRLAKMVMRPLCKMEDEYYHVVIFGTGPAGYMCAQTLRQEGFVGKITMVTKDKYLPYDRPKLTKAPGIEWEEIKLRDENFYKSADIEVRLGVHIGRVDIVEHKLFLASNDYNEYISYEKLVIANGLRARFFGPNVKGYNLKNIVRCSNLEESLRIGRHAVGKNVLIVGSSFVGMELASSLKDKVASLNILSRHQAPYGAVFGETTGKIFLNYFLSQAPNVVFHPSDEVKYFEGNENDEVIKAVTIKKVVLECELVILAMGAVPNTEMFEGSPLKLHEMDRTIICNKYMQTSYDSTYAVGDIANFPMKIGARDRVSIAHWQVALTTGKVAALNILERNVSISDIVPFFWTSLAGVNIRYTGYGECYDRSEIYGDISKLKFCTVYTRLRKVIGFLTVGCDPLAAKMANKLEFQEDWKEDLPYFLTEIFPNPPITGDLCYGFRPKDREYVTMFDLGRQNLPPQLIPDQVSQPSKMFLPIQDSDEENNLIIPEDSVLPTIRERMVELKRDQLLRRRYRLNLRKLHEAKTEVRIKAWARQGVKNIRSPDTPALPLERLKRPVGKQVRKGTKLPPLSSMPPPGTFIQFMVPGIRIVKAVTMSPDPIELNESTRPERRKTPGPSILKKPKSKLPGPSILKKPTSTTPLTYYDVPMETLKLPPPMPPRKLKSRKSKH